MLRAPPERRPQTACPSPSNVQLPATRSFDLIRYECHCDLEVFSGRPQQLIGLCVTLATFTASCSAAALVPLGISLPRRLAAASAPRHRPGSRNTVRTALVRRMTVQHCNTAGHCMWAHCAEPRWPKSLSNRNTIETHQLSQCVCRWMRMRR